LGIYRQDVKSGVLRGSKAIADSSLCGLARPPRLLLGERKRLRNPPMRQLMGVENRRRGALVVRRHVDEELVEKAVRKTPQEEGWC
jgi:hypothetical protein